MKASLHDALGAGDPGALDALYRRFLDDPHAVPRDLARAFAQLAEAGSVATDPTADAWRRHGYHVALLDPLKRTLGSPVELPDHPLKSAYGGSIGWQIMHLEADEPRAWLMSCAENGWFSPTGADKDRMLAILVRTEALEDTLQRRFPTLKRFGIEGAEAFLVLCDQVLRTAAAGGVRHLVCGGMHRGRLNLLANFGEKPVEAIVSELTGHPNLPPGPGITGDVAYHNGWSGERKVEGTHVRLTILPHVSHLALIAPVTLGKARAVQGRVGSRGKDRVLPVILHTDAAFAGQGVIAETLQLSRLPAYDTGGAIHLILDNNLGFTTEPTEARSTTFASDLATGYGVPVLHVNGDAPDAVFRVATVAAEFRRLFRRDIVVTMHAYRRLGHNEMDEPRFTQPKLYRTIDAHPRLAAGYAQALVAGPRVEELRVAAEAAIVAAVDSAGGYRPNATGYRGFWSRLRRADDGEAVAFIGTGLPLERLRRIGQQLTSVPDGFALHPKIARFLESRRLSLEAGKGLTWSTAEALALATLAEEGFGIRLGGQDTVRGAFAQRNVVLHDQVTGARHVIYDGLPRLEVFNTPISEQATLAFEYGHSLGDPTTLCCWEAQFGDFLNLAQAAFDQFLVAGEARWMRSSGLTLLLPHGLDGGGPDHSTARPERLLAAGAGQNLQVAAPSTPAQYFHLLRRQMQRPFRIPLAVLAPKAMLRAAACVSDLADFRPETGFRGIIADPPTRARRVILCSGKAAHELVATRRVRGLDGAVALVRVEQLHPVDSESLATAVAAQGAEDVVWFQEEPANMGPFAVLDRQIAGILGREVRLISRPAAAAAATGVHTWHESEAAELLDRAFEDL
jgi:2-oxoglutarate dehydrogenase E1 component